MGKIMEIPTHKQWTKLRDEAGGKSNMVKSVNMGKLLDDYHNAGVGQKSTFAALVAQVRYITPLSAGVKKYRDSLPKDKKALIELCDDIDKLVAAKIKMGAELANPSLKLRQYLEGTLAGCKALVVSGDLAAYGKLWGGQVRGVGTSLGDLGKKDPVIENIRKVWLPYTSSKWESAQIAPKALSPAEQAVEVKKAAKEIGGLAMKVQSELKKLKVIN